MGPRSLSTVTTFSAGRVGTPSLFASLDCCIYVFVFSFPQRSASFPDFVISGKLYVRMGKVGGITLFLQDPTALLSEHLTWKENRVLPIRALCPASQIWTSERDKLSGLGLGGGQGAVFPVSGHPQQLMPAELGPSWGGYLGWLRSISPPCCSGTQERGVCKYFVTCKS